MSQLFYKGTDADGLSFHRPDKGERVKYEPGKTVKISRSNRDRHPQLCTDTLLHACRKPNQLLQYCLPMKVFEVTGEPVIEEKDDKAGFYELKVLREVPESEHNVLFGWNIVEVRNPVNPLKMSPTVTEEDRALMRKWDQVRDQVWAQVRAQVWAQFWDQVRDQVWDQVRDQVWAQVRAQVWAQFWDQVRDQVWAQVRAQVWAQFWDQVRDQVWAQVRDQVWAQFWDQVRAQAWTYIGDIFHSEEHPWIHHDLAGLWRRGLVFTTFNGKLQLRGGPQMNVLYEEAQQ
jgi:hypothetical protein